MTTIVYDHKNKQIACDSRVNGNGLILSDKEVKYKENEKGLWFFCGAVSDNDQMMEMSHNDKPDVLPDCSALLVKDGDCYLVTFNGGYCAISKNNYSHSIGSGGDYALCALDFGSTAKEALKYASTKDCYTGGKLRLYDIKTEKFI
tara:strand:- start:43 stop:480 length:438 start_codon:yes stop_codon:yes gene_type:complete